MLAFIGACIRCNAGSCNHDELNKLLVSTVMVRRLKKEVLDQLPPKRRQQVMHCSIPRRSQWVLATGMQQALLNCRCS